MSGTTARDTIRAALAMLGVERLALMIHNSSFPSLAEEELGCGTPFSHGGRAFVRFVHELGFDTLILGPQGQPQLTQRSPYKARSSSRSLLNFAPLPLCSPRQQLVTAAHLQRLVQGAPVSQGGAQRDRVDFAYAWNSVHGLLEGAHAALSQADETRTEVRSAFRDYVDTMLVPGAWLQRDALCAALRETYGSDDSQRWPPSCQELLLPDAVKSDARVRRLQALAATMPRLVERFAFGQFLMQRQHGDLRAEASALGLALFAEVIGPLGESEIDDVSLVTHLQNDFDGLIFVDAARPGPSGWATTSTYFDTPVWAQTNSGDRGVQCIEQLSRVFDAAASHVAVCFSDLFGLTESFAGPQTAPDMQFTLRVPSDYARSYYANAAGGRALDLGKALASALRRRIGSSKAIALANQLELQASGS